MCFLLFQFVVLFFEDVSEKAFYPNDFSTWVDVISKIITTLGLFLGAGWILWNYSISQRLRAGEILLKMEEEFRHILPIYEQIDTYNQYKAGIEPTIKKVLDEEHLSKEDATKLYELDRCLRFFLICSVLDQELKIERKVLIRCYYYYVEILTQKSSYNREALLKYVEKYFPTLYTWGNKLENQVVINQSKKPVISTVINKNV